MGIKTRKAAFMTLGCRINQYETDSLAGEFSAAGFSIIDHNNPGADVCVINTCSVTGRGEQKSRQAVARMRRLHPEALLIITGCAVERNASAFAAQPGILLVDQDRKHAIARLAIERLAAGSTSSLPNLESIPRDRFNFSPPAVSLHTRASLKVQDGCNNHCSYCIIPQVRGAAISRPAADCLEAAQQLIQLGYREIVISGVNLQQYSSGGLTLTDLVKRLLELPGTTRFRISSIEPDEQSFGIVELFAHPRLCPHLHLCLQSGSDTILAQMGRHYTRSLFLEIVQKLRESDPLFNISADVIVGYPGELDENFTATLDAIRAARLSHAHTFQFSAREGTRAADLDGQVPLRIMQERSEAVRALVATIRAQYLTMFQGKSEELLVERVDPIRQTAQGYGQHYLPITHSWQTGTPPPRTNSLLMSRIVGISQGKLPGLLGENPA